MTSRFLSEQLWAGWSRVEQVRQDGGENQEFSFGSIEFEMSFRHTSKDVEEAAGC